jgi:hypothetical protein
MAPIWFSRHEVPFEKMWADDIHWYPLFFAGKLFRGIFHFKDTHTLGEYGLKEVARPRRRGEGEGEMAPPPPLFPGTAPVDVKLP